MNNMLKNPEYSFKKHYFEIAFFSVFFTMVQFTAFKIYDYLNINLESQSEFVTAPALVAVFFAVILFLELNSVPFHRVSKKISFRQFISHIIIFSIAISYQFAMIYNTLYILNPKSFQSVNSDGYFSTFFDFFFYSIGILSSSSQSSIMATTFYGKFISMVESLMFFYIIVIIVANYKEVGKSKMGSQTDIVSGYEKK
ncbi:MAG: hypothetical protein A2X18_12785 [Bacteroidetes bacterium GWF2_40_14]|nr:MAG: hypothetical protein A2X18_12785 [Bacteroidetes bacterium GWF2_40_14]